MSIEFNRRTFLKTGAALVGATALVGLTGCDSSSNDSHPINKAVGEDQTFDVGGIIVDPSENGTISGTDSSKTYSISFEIKANSAASLYNDAVSIYYKGNYFPVTIKVDSTVISARPVQIAAGQTADMEFSCAVPADATLQDIIVKLHYNDKSVKFQNIDSKLKTSGVYTDKL